MTFAAHRARKRFGQHWLIDQSVLDRIVAAAQLGPEDRVLEVGPGRGALTERLLASPAASVQAVELDRDLVQGLRQRFSDDHRFHLIEGDALVVALPAADKVVANIPYNITGPLLDRLLGRLDRPVDPPYAAPGVAGAAGGGRADPGQTRQQCLLGAECADAVAGALPVGLQCAAPVLSAAAEGDVRSDCPGAAGGFRAA